MGNNRLHSLKRACVLRNASQEEYEDDRTGVPQWYAFRMSAEERTEPRSC
jgi:hypothetical protein